MNFVKIESKLIEWDLEFEAEILKRLEEGINPTEPDYLKLPSPLVIIYDVGVRRVKQNWRYQRFVEMEVNGIRIEISKGTSSSREFDFFDNLRDGSGDLLRPESETSEEIKDFVLELIDHSIVDIVENCMKYVMEPEMKERLKEYMFSLDSYFENLKIIGWEKLENGIWTNDYLEVYLEELEMACYVVVDNIEVTRFNVCRFPVLKDEVNLHLVLSLLEVR